MLEWRRGGLTDEILANNVVMSGGSKEIPELESVSFKEDTDLSHWHDEEWYCVLPEIKTVLIDGPGKYVNRDGRVVTIATRRPNESFPKHVWVSFDNGGEDTFTSQGCWAPSCITHSFDLVAKYVEPAKPKVVLLEEWAFLGDMAVHIQWRKSEAGLSLPGWFKTGVTRELEVPCE